MNMAASVARAADCGGAPALVTCLAIRPPSWVRRRTMRSCFVRSLPSDRGPLPATGYFGSFKSSPNCPSITSSNSGS
jgi:hypothetical protein